MTTALPTPAPSALVESLRARTPARVFVGRAGPAYRTGTQLELRRDHAAALDAVHADLDSRRDFGVEFVERWSLFAVATQANDRTEFLLRPDLGRRLAEEARATLAERCPKGVDVQIVIADGLSALAVARQVPALLTELDEAVRRAGWSVGQTFFVRHGRVGIFNDIGDILDPAVVVLLIGERPGLATADSLSAYMAYRPRTGHTDAQRNLISNIHGRGVSVSEAAARIVQLARKMRTLQSSGVAVKE